MENRNKSTNHGSDVFVLVEEYYPNEGRNEDVLNIAKESSKSIIGVNGLLISQTLSSKKTDGPVCNITTWESEQDFKNFMKSDAVKELYQSEMMTTVKEATNDIKVSMYHLESGWHQ